jgi:triphosphatase
MDPPSGFSPTEGPPPAERRGLRLVADNGGARAEPPAAWAPVKAERVTLHPDSTLDAAIVCILSSCLDHFAANAPALRKTEDPEAVHQMRVALRRLRAFLALLKRKASITGLEEIAGQAKALAGVLGEGRDFDVFREALEQAPALSLGAEPSFIALIKAVELRRHQARKAARVALAAPATTQFMRALRHLIAERPWRESLKGCEAEGSARVFAVQALNRLHRRAMSKGEGLEDLPPEQRHQARIALKKIRYGAEFFQSLFARKRVHDYVRHLAAAQDLLGEENDRATAARILCEIENAETAPAIWFLRGWSAAAASLGESKSAEASRRLKKLEPFWR